MKPIKKNRKPKELTAFEIELKKSENYSSINTFTALKGDQNTLIPIQISLAEEQGYVCCYCLSELKTRKDAHDRDRVKIEIEHYKPKSIFNGEKNNASDCSSLCDGLQRKRLDLRIEYSNLLGACQTSNQCGNAKSDTELCFIPNPSITKSKDFPRLGYNMKGRIRSLELDETKNVAIQKELNDVLGLNNKELKIRRTNRWIGIRNKIKSKLKIKTLHTGGKREIDYVKGLIDIYSKRKNGKHFEFYSCIVYLLKREYKNELK